MKTPRSLPETDLARAALLPADQKLMVLRGVRAFVPPHSLMPLRRVAGALYEARASLFDLPRRGWPEIESAIRKYCGTNLHWVEPNLYRAKLLFEFNKARALKAVEWEFPILPFGYGAKIKFWHDFYSIQYGVPVLSFIDPRLTDGLGIFGRTFVFSAMHHNVAIGDFEGAKLEIIRFPFNKQSRKHEVEVFTFDDRDIIEESTLNKAIDDTYRVWREILAERTKEGYRPEKKASIQDQFDF